jgi:superfamily II DNA/RNA helicase
MAAILGTSRKSILRTNPKGEYIINGSKLTKLTLSSTWQPLADLSRTSHKILAYRTNGTTLRHFIYDVYSELRSSLEFDPHAIDDFALLKKPFEQAPELAVLCRSYYGEILLKQDTWIVWVEYAIEELFIELVLGSIGSNVGSLHRGLKSKERKNLCAQFNNHSNYRSGKPNVLVATYRAGVSVKLQSHHSIQFTRALHRKMEMQASGHLRCQ